MKKSAILDKIQTGKSFIVFAEYRGSTPDMLTLRDKVTSQTRQRPLIKHRLEVGEFQISLTEWLPDGADPVKSVPSFKKGELIAVELSALIREAGLYKASGTLLAVEA